MKIMFAILFFTMSCSTIQNELPNFDSEVNCSDRAKSVIKLRDTKNKHSTGFQSKETKAKKEKREAYENGARELIVNAYPELGNCYQSYLNQKNTGKFNVCLVLATDEKGVLGFIDIEDNANKIPKNFFSCMLDEVSKINFKSYPSTVIDMALPFDYRINLARRYQSGR